MKSNSVLTSNDFSETTGQILMKFGHNDHLVVRIKFLLENGPTPRVLNLLMTSPLKPLVKFE